MKLLLICLIVAMVKASIIKDYVEKEWEYFKMQYNKKYDTVLKEKLHKIAFIKNFAEVYKHEYLYRRGLVSYTLAINEFSDIPDKQFSSIMTQNINNKLINDVTNLKDVDTFMESPFTSIPKSVDWRKRGAVTKVKNQRYCGSAWAFSAVGALEGQIFLKTRNLTNLSEQNLVDCAFTQGNEGCSGGSAIAAFWYIRDNGGIDTEESYPYVGAARKCKYNPKFSGASVKGIKRIEEYSETSLEEAVATLGPISVLLDASGFKQYSQGIFHYSNCSSSLRSLNHGMLLVGYNNDNIGGEYWLLKNSWGPTWGENGYMKLAKNRDNHCGIATMAIVPIV